MSERPPDLPGCRPFHLPASELETWESRIEVWDGRTETAWVCEPATIYHEQPTRCLTWVASRIAQARGSPIKCIGSADLLEPDASGGKRWIMQADEVTLFARCTLSTDGVYSAGMGAEAGARLRPL